MLQVDFMPFLENNFQSPLLEDLFFSFGKQKIATKLHLESLNSEMPASLIGECTFHFV